MAQLLIRDIDEETVTLLKAKAAANHRSLEAELRTIVTAAAKMVSVAEARAQADKIRERIGRGGRILSDSSELIREDRYQ
ncbi:hypothetical protein V5E97_04420 [Singulisphaera sp. Ch08]|uniref:Antitoxin FitA-like ribbon-helix-helix domain-containing protein n=1 Tax=Singulisphaera sp. Ch08 TaxID=3120278 RepID=A0AAU7CJ55_9BACT